MYCFKVSDNAEIESMTVATFHRQPDAKLRSSTKNYLHNSRIRTKKSTYQEKKGCLVEYEVTEK